MPLKNCYPKIFKRLFDLLGAVVGLTLFVLPFLVIAVVVKTTSEGPVFFRQSRVGRRGEVFKILKFRTMMQAAGEGGGVTVAGDTRITRVGHYLRNTKLDELPQLVNVICGDMSLVGPRPELLEFTKQYSKEDYDIVLSVRPGLTDFASVRFRNESQLLAQQDDPLKYYKDVIMPRKLRYYRFYVRNMSPLLDVHIISATIISLIWPIKGDLGDSSKATAIAEENN